MGDLLVNHKPVRGVVEIAPSGGDDMPTLAAAMVSRLRGGASHVRLLKGAWKFDTLLSAAMLAAGASAEDAAAGIPSDTTIEFAPGCTITGSLAGTGVGNYTNSYLYAANKALNTATTLAADGTDGAVSISVTDKPDPAIAWAVGHSLIITAGTGAVSTIREVVGVAGAGPYTLTLDRPLPRLYASGSLVQRTSCPTNIRIVGNGAVFTGSGDRLVEIFGANKCHVSGLKTAFGNTLDGPCISFDIASRDSVGEDLDFHAVNCGFFAESAERIRYLRCVTRGGAAGMAFHACIDSWFESCSAHACTGNGFEFKSYLDLDAENCINCGVKDSSATACGGAGVKVTNAAVDTKIFNCRLSSNTGPAVYLTKKSLRTTIRDRSGSGNTGHGVAFDCGCTGTTEGVSLANLLVDGDMEAAATTAYTATGGATLSKQTGSPKVGTRNLRIAGGSGGARQTVLTLGVQVRMSGWVRGDGAGNGPGVYLGEVNAANGNQATTWQWADCHATPSASTNFAMINNGAGGFVEADDVCVHVLTD